MMFCRNSQSIRCTLYSVLLLTCLVLHGRHTLNVLGFINEPQQAPMPFAPAAMQTADTTSSLPGTTLMWVMRIQVVTPIRCRMPCSSQMHIKRCMGVKWHKWRSSALWRVSSYRLTVPSIVAQQALGGDRLKGGLLCLCWGGCLNVIG
jgi:hypothetical protein